jgi:Family of unknown function (DUF6166)
MYTGKIIDDGEIKDVDRIVTNGNGKTLDLDASLKVVNHSPTGFCWGYLGSGPAQLSLAILLDHLNGDRERALALYQDFKFKVIQWLPMDSDFVLTDEQIETAITEIDVARLQKA